MEGEKLPLGRATESGISVSRRAAAKCSREEPLQVEGLREAVRKEYQLEGPRRKKQIQKTDGETGARSCGMLETGGAQMRLKGS